MKETRLRTALDASTEMILITDARGLIEYANPALCRFSGYPPEALQGRSPSLLDSPETDQALIAEMNRQLASGHPWAGRLRQRRRDGSEYWAEINVTPILGPGGEINGYVQIQRDISKRI
ncbi:MAG TPA: PAS domain S-box protein, partial [Methylothermaceae bacterium]|nr:PAS domain S-box protein [Methylothermaceae bacterium]